MKPNHLVRAVSLLVLTSAALTAQVARQAEVPLKNWSAPLYWQPNQSERATSGSALPQLQFSANAVSTNALTFIAITPCRLVDTRGAAAGFNGMDPFAGPSILAKGTLTVPVQSASEATTDTEPAPCGVIPSIAQAYSFNLTVVPHAGGAVDYISLWPAGSAQPYVATLNDPQGAIVANAAIVPAGTPTGGISVYNDGPATTDVIIDMNGYFAAPTDLNLNTAVGAGTLQYNTTGAGNTATGFDALQGNIDGEYNTAMGGGALQYNNTGGGNTATGVDALQNNVGGNDNTANGVDALQNNTGNNNTASGYGALSANTTGSGNIAVGYQAASSAPAGNSNSIYIGSVGAAGDLSGTIRIGTEGTQAGAYIAGISGVGVSGAGVLVNGNGQLGIAVSSRRFKEQITDMGDSSSKVLQLRPVNFFYKPQYDDGAHLLQYGLIAEEVEKVYPEMVAYDKDGQILTVKYQMLAPMLLNEVQKQNTQLQSQDRQLQSQNSQLQDQNAQLENQVQLQQEENRKLEDRLAALEALLSGQTAVPVRP